MTLNYDKIAEQAAARGVEMAPASDAEDAHTEYEASLNQESEQTPKAKPSSLQQARDAMRAAQEIYDLSGHTTQKHLSEAATLAAIAQAESLERIANAVERLVSDVKRREGEL